MNEMQVHALVRGVLVPFFVSGGSYILARAFPLQLREATRAVGLAVAVLLSYLVLIGTPDWPWTGSPKGLVVALLASILWIPLELWGNQKLWFKRILFLSAVAVICLRPMVENSWTWPQIMLNIFSIASLGTFFWVAIERGSQQMHPAASLAGLVVLAATSAGFIGLTGSASLAQVAGALAAGLGAAALLSFVPFLRARFEMVEVTVVALTALWCVHGFYVDINWMQTLWLLGPLGWMIFRDLIHWSGKSPLVDSAVTVILSLPGGLWVLWNLYLQSVAQQN